jgi:steroid delta-isomerase-like uncharacterized protein
VIPLPTGRGHGKSPTGTPTRSIRRHDDDDTDKRGLLQGQPPGRAGAKHLLVDLTTTFPDLQVTIEEVLQDGHKVIVRSTITGTQREPFMEFPAKHRKMTIQAVDIHEFHDGEIVRTWHTEDWLTGLQQLGVFEP